MKRYFITGIMMLSIFYLKAQSPPVADTAKKTATQTFSKVEIESEFPGGLKGWSNFLSANLVYPKKAYKKRIQGQVVANFIVEKDGSLSNIEILSGPPELWQAVLDVLNQSPRWTPAVQDGKKVKSYKHQPINFKLESQ